MQAISSLLYSTNDALFLLIKKPTLKSGLALYTGTQVLLKYNQMFFSIFCHIPHDESVLHAGAIIAPCRPIAKLN